MEHYSTDRPSQPRSQSNFAHPLPESPPVFAYMDRGEVSGPQYSRHSNRVAPLHIKAYSTSDVVPESPESPITARFCSQSRPRHRSTQETFYPKSDIPSLSSPSTMPSPSTWTSPSMRTPVQRSMEHNSVLGHNRSNSRKGSGRKLPSGRLTCHAWFMHGVCNKAPGQCQYSHMHMGQGVSPIPSAEIHGQPIEEEIICQTDFLTPVSNVRHYEAHSPELEGFESHSDGPLVVGPRSCSQPYEMRAKIYSIVALSNSLQSMVQNPQTPVSNHSGARRSPAISPLSVEMNKARDLIQELHVEMQTYHTVVERLQPRLLDFAEPLRNAAHAMNITQRDSSLIELIRMAADEVRVIIGRHRVAEWLNVDKKEP